MNSRNAITILFFLFATATGPSLHASELSLAEATARAIEKHPSLASFDAEKRAAEARIISALARPNPNLDMEMEDILGSGEYREFQSAIYTVGISQLLELGGKRHLRGNVARAEAEIEQLRYEVARREIVLETARRFVAVLTAQAAENNAVEVVKIARENADSVSGLKEGGRGSDLDVKRAELELKQARLRLENHARATTISRQQLAAMWGDREVDFDRASGKLTEPTASPPLLENLREKLEDHPLLYLAKTGTEAAREALVVEQKKTVPDLEVGVAYRRDTVVEDNAAVLFFSLPLPLWNRNEGGIAEAEAVIDQKEALTSRAQTRLELSLTETWTRLSGALEEHQLIAGEMLPAAEEIYESLSESFRLGRASYLELLEARRSLIATRQESIQTLARYHTARVELEALTSASQD